jgi:hypothetical protein
VRSIPARLSVWPTPPRSSRRRTKTWRQARFQRRCKEEGRFSTRPSAQLLKCQKAHGPSTQVVPGSPTQLKQAGGRLRACSRSPAAAPTPAPARHLLPSNGRSSPSKSCRPLPPSSDTELQADNLRRAAIDKSVKGPVLFLFTQRCLLAHGSPRFSASSPRSSWWSPSFLGNCPVHLSMAAFSPTHINALVYGWGIQAAPRRDAVDHGPSFRPGVEAAARACSITAGVFLEHHHHRRHVEPS